MKGFSVLYSLVFFLFSIDSVSQVNEIKRPWFFAQSDSIQTSNIGNGRIEMLYLDSLVKFGFALFDSTNNLWITSYSKNGLKVSQEFDPGTSKLIFTSFKLPTDSIEHGTSYYTSGGLKSVFQIFPNGHRYEMRFNEYGSLYYEGWFNQVRQSYGGVRYYESGKKEMQEFTDKLGNGDVVYYDNIGNIVAIYQFRNWVMDGNQYFYKDNILESIELHENGRFSTYIFRADE